MAGSTDLGERLAKLVPLLSSDHPGEVVATAAAIDRALKADRLDWHDFSEALQVGLQAKAQPAPPPPARRARPGPPEPPAEPYRGPQTPWNAAALEVMNVALEQLTPAENRFLTRMIHWRGEPTEAQQRWLRSICAKFGMEVEGG